MDRKIKLKEYLKASPSDSFLKHALALEYVKSDEDDDARDLFEEILTNDPGYVGSYYHLAKLLERNGENDLAVQWYKKGMDAAKAVGDNHSYNELQGAFDDLIY